MATKKAIKKGTVYIVHHVDTEGPLSEPVAETFKRLETVLGIKIALKKDKANLLKLQKGLGVKGNETMISKIKMLLNPHQISLNENWKQIYAMLDTIMSKNFRNVVKDSFGGGWIFNWHVMDHVGFTTNERGRDLGYFKVFDVYEKYIKKHESFQDKIHWHFHPISFHREAHISATSYENSYPEIHQVLCRRLIEKEWFPRVNRAGFHTERPDSNWFLEQWIPFDPSNQSIDPTTSAEKEIQTDAINGRFGDWSGAPSNWDLYHPSLYDWRKRGDLKRVIARVLNMRGRFRNINKQELEKAFAKASRGENVYVGITNHDWRDMAVEINAFRALLTEVSDKFPNAQFKFSESVEAFRNILAFSPQEIKKNRIDMRAELEKNVLTVNVTNGELFGSQPYLAIKTKAGEYFHDNFDFGVSPKEYFYTFDRLTVPLEKIEAVAVASNDKYGNCCINKINLRGTTVHIKKIFIR